MILGSTNVTKIKSRNEVVPAFTGNDRWYKYYDNGVLEHVTNLTYPIPAVGSFESIAYEQGKDVFFKNCRHQRTRNCSTRRDQSFFDFWINDGDEHRFFGDRFAYCHRKAIAEDYVFPMYPTAEFFDPPFVSNSELEDILAEGLKNMVPRIENLTDKFNLLNFLYELKDLKQMFTFWSRQSGVLKNFANGNLNYFLGWKPFIGDCERIFGKVLKLSENIKAWNDQARSGEIFTRHANLSKLLMETMNLTSDPQSSDVSVASYGGVSREDSPYIEGSYNYWFDQTTTHEHEMFAHLYFKPKVIKTRFIEDQISIWVDALGVGDGASTVWNALPFTFVLDWFWGFGKFLENFEVDAVDVGFDIVDFGYSHKWEYNYQRNYHLGFNGDNDAFGFNFGTVSQDQKIYVRKRCHPPVHRLGEIDWSPLWGFNLPSWKQFWVGTNLLYALNAD